MFRLAVPVLLALTSLACKAPVEAPADLGEASIYAYANFDSETGDELIATVATIEAYMDTVDLEGPVNDRTLSLPIITADNFGSITGPDGVDVNLQVPIAVSGKSRQSIQANIDLVAEPNYVCVESNTTKYAMRTFPTPIDCFVDGTCDTVEAVQETRKESMIADVWYDWYKTFRIVELEDGRRVMFGRGWIDQVWLTDNGNGSWDQSYVLDVWIEDGAETKRYGAFWSSVTLGGVGDDVWANLVKGGIDEANSNADDFIDGELCNNDRDRENDRP